MTITFYRTSSEKNRLVKVLSDATSLYGTLKDNTDVVHPTIKFANVGNFNLTTFNYCRINELNRYYFIDDITIESNGIFSADLSVDVLMTYSDGIRALNCAVKEYSGNNAENELDTSAEFDTSEIEYDNPFTNIDGSAMVLVALNGSNT